jgi:CheY-like chemotaxis protein
MPKLILLVEDSADDALLFKLALNQAGVVNSLVNFTTSEDAIAYLKGEIPFHDRAVHPFPSLICVDLKLNGRDGLHLLDWLKNSADCSNTLLLVLSGHHELKEVRAAYGLGADSFLTKPIHPKDVVNLVLAYPEYWNVKT